MLLFVMLLTLFPSFQYRKVYYDFVDRRALFMVKEVLPKQMSLFRCQGIHLCLFVYLFQS